jgi:hypothetical protein
MVQGASKGESSNDAGASEEKVNSRSEKSVCLLVLGMHRSGTSALARVLSLMGAALPRHLMGSGSGNETGHWEPQRLVEYNNKLFAELGSSWDDWRALDLARLTVRRRDEIRSEVTEIISADFPEKPLFVLKDPRICRIAPLVLDALDNAGTETFSILAVRNPLEVAESLQRRAEYWSPELTRADAGLLWLRHVLDAEAATRHRSRGFISYDSLLSDWKGALTALTQQIVIPWPYTPDEVAGQVDQFLAPEQRHHRRTSEEVVLDPVLRHWVSEAYAALLVLERNPLSEAALERLARIRTEFDRVAPIMDYMATELRRAAGATSLSLRTELKMAEYQFKSAAATLMSTAQKQVAAEAETQRVKAELSTLVTELEEGKAAAELEAGRVKAELSTLVTCLEEGKAAAESEARRVKAELSALVTALEEGKAAAESEARRVKAELSALVTALEEGKAAAESEVQRIKAELLAADIRYSEQQIAFTSLHIRTAELSERLAVCEPKLQKLNRRLSRSYFDIAVTRQALVEIKRNNKELSAQLAQSGEKSKSFEETVAEKEIQLRAAEVRLATAEAINHAYRLSTSWKLTAPMRGLKRLPNNLPRWSRVVRNAVRIGGGFFPTIRKVLRVYREEGKAGLKLRYDFVTNLKSAVIGATQSVAAEWHSQSYSPSKSSVPPPRTTSNDVEPAAQRSDETSKSRSSLQLRLAEIRRALLEEQRPLVQRVATWAKPPAAQPLTLEDAEQRLLRVAPQFGRGLIVSLSHDDYHRVVGGVQLCLQLEELEFSKNGYVYLALHPFQPLPVLARETDPNKFQFQAAVNGQMLGSITAATLQLLLERHVPPGESICCIVHSLLGHAPEVVTYLFRSIVIRRALFWLHDYFSICPNHVLLRNDIIFCNAPSPQSTSCFTCCYGAERNNHLSRLEALFAAITFDIASPSHFALNLWQKQNSVRHRETNVLPLCYLTSPQTLPPGAPPNERHPVRIAFLGHSVFHKGWHVFAQLSSAFADDRRYAFHHLGQRNTGSPAVRFTKVSTSAADPHVMSGTIAKIGIDVALIWPEWPETFSFTYQEAVAGGALVVTNPHSGNVQAAIRANGMGHIAMNETQLLALLEGGDLIEMIRRRRAQGRIIYRLEFSELSRTFVT